MKGQKEAINLANKTYKNVPAYRKFLRLRKQNFKRISTWDKFVQLPITTKQNYRLKYLLEDLMSKDEAPKMIYSSSGSSGSPTYWPLGDKSESRDADLHEYLFSKVFEIEKNSRVLVVDSFAMGLWIAGVYTLLATRELNSRGFKVTTITPGIDRNNITNIFEKLAPRYDHVVLAGYPPFVTDVINQLCNSKNLHKSLKIISGGDKCTEAWRNDIRKKLRNKIKITDLANIYGTSDAAIIAHETQLSIFIRNEANKNKKLYEDLFGDAPILPAVFQYDPSKLFIEIVDDELVLTIDGSVPLVRYNIHDVGNILYPRDVKKILNKHSLLAKAIKSCSGEFLLPILYTKGRTDVAVPFYALNLYPEHISNGLSARISREYLTGSYLTYTKEVGKGRREKLYLEVELKHGKLPPSSNKIKIEEEICKGIISSNIEYKKLADDIGNKVFPKIKFVHNGELATTKKGAKALAHFYGKKPRVLE